MNTKMYVGNLPFSATQEDIQSLFSQFGSVTDVFLPMDRVSGRPRGFAFVTMGTPEEMQAAINGLNGAANWMGWTLPTALFFIGIAAILLAMGILVATGAIGRYFSLNATYTF